MTLACARRATEVEIMDTGGYGAEEIRANLSDLRSYNRWLGGSRLIRREVARLLAAGGLPGRVTLLDVATGSADIPAAVARWCARQGIDLIPCGLDANADVLHEARRLPATPAAGPAGRVHLIQADARRLPCPDRSIDMVVCSNFLHHLDGAAAVEALREMGRVARRDVVVVDLTRGRAALTCVWLLTRLTTRNRLTRNDGPLSVQRAFTPQEMEEMAREAGLPRVAVRRLGPVRMMLTSEVE